jgi:hypothetical protein
MATLAEGSSASCRFDYHDATASRALRITVEDLKEPGQATSAYKTRCGAGPTALRAIGNEACSQEINGQTYGAEVIGRVRNQIFTITLTTSARHDPFMPRQALQDNVRDIAEQVAGALF